ncbi:TPA: D-alanine--poly(phosphoribitol) ligase [Klebsiella pneumoniae]|uniref:AMP-binding protein n=2 Tax=Enterobacteriaceae TaxID=543 RepID=A0ABW1Q2P7_9ENTR|nr:MULTISPECIES: AMP-binding protein [Enterobacteriaceae]MBS6741439.1 AMP-binding protein [Enterobacteriaceae bacterium]PXW53440.1 D-alanine--poly(phosphoribitol) ligase subunit 1 [Grimontella sp. AG753]SLK13699.1 D-alanine--poly(phosphoribitol) ligase subunit 1 [Enterobacter sp. NFR05]HAH1170885.1 D-alanine--poly(phosphoribitol) ligase [Escherichia coli]HBQ3761208.1 AMP-binding protein [Klebsiella quasipneumoniae subsp. similipneumoniae]
MKNDSELLELQDFLRAALRDPASPQQLAISGSDEAITWQQLSVAVTDWAQRYQQCNQPAGTPVVLYGHQQAEFAVALYSCLLHNIPYIPVDCIYPQERLKEICQLANAPFYYDVAAKKFIATGITGQVLAEPDLAYIMFTSGSTGKPKGVQIGRESVWHFMKWVSQDFSLPEKPVLMNHAVFSFDLSLIPLLANLATGGHIVLNAKEDIAAENWLDRLKANDVSVWVSTPSFAYQRLLSPQFNSDYLPELNVFIFIGEVLNKALVKQLRRRFPQAKILNSYGPTEATIATTVVEITDEILNNDNPLLPVGVMMPDTHMEITADGELIIWGKNVMRGYLGLPQENATKLLRRESEEYRGYRTGDLGYEDGLIYCQGRNDSQIKLNGYRIEINEIENRLLAMSGISEAVVLPLMKSCGSVLRIAAFCVTDLAPEVIKTSLSKVIPHYMVPSQIIIKDALPLNPNGKIDRKLLDTHARTN